MGLLAIDLLSLFPFPSFPPLANFTSIDAHCYSLSFFFSTRCFASDCLYPVIYSKTKESFSLLF